METAPTLPRARELVLQYGWTSTVYQILNPGIRHWFSSATDGVVGYVAAGRTRVVAGAPVCAHADLARVAAEFESDAGAAGQRVCYFGAEGRIEALYRDDPHHAFLALGAAPSWQPSGWAERLERHTSLRAQLRRARNKGVVVQEWPSRLAENHPALMRCLEAWLATRGLPPLHFLVEPKTLAHLEDRRVFVAERSGVPLGFVVASPVPTRSGWLIEQFVRDPAAPNGCTELVIDGAVSVLAQEGAQYLTLGLAPLSRRASPAIEQTAWPWNSASAWARAHGRRFYNFDGLDAFKAKFDPERWDPVYAVSNEPRFSVASLHAIAAAFSGGSPLALAARGLVRAIVQELTWLANPKRRGSSR